jgi:methanogenic corrinoid protein MtbC1
MIENISAAVQSGNIKLTEDLIAAALKDNVPPAVILKDGLAARVLEMKKKFREKEILDSEIIMAEKALEAGIDILMTDIKHEQESFIGTAVTGTVEGDIRETEKKIISAMARILNVSVIDLGTGVPAAGFINAAVKEKANVIVCTTDLTIFLPRMKELVQAATLAGVRGKIKILLSGAPVTEWFCKSIDADMYAPDPLQAAETAAGYCEKINKK